MKFTLNIKSKIIFSFIGLGLTAGIIGLNIIFFIGKASLKESIGKTFKEVASLTSDRMELLIEHHIEEAFNLTSSHIVQSSVSDSNQTYKGRDNNHTLKLIKKIEKDWSSIDKKSVFYKNIIDNKTSAFLKNYENRYNFRAADNTHINLIVTDINGVVVAATKDPDHYYYGNSKSWITSFNKGKGKNYLSGIEHNYLIDNYIFSIAVPIKNKNKVIGIFIMVHEVKKFFGWVTTTHVGNTDHTMLATSDGTLLFCPIFSIGTHSLSTSLKELIFKNEPGWGTSNDDVHYLGETLNGFAPVKITKTMGPDNFDGKTWYIFTSQAPEETYAPIYKLLNWILTTGLAGTVIWIILGWLIAENIVKPISKLKKGAQVIGEGNLDYSMPIETRDEIGDLTKDFNKMAKKLKISYTELERLDKVKSDFVSKVSHELRTPLTSIKGFVEILSSYDNIDKETNKEFLNIINEESERLSRLINDLLDLSRIESGKIEMVLQPINLSETIEFCLKTMKVMAAGKKLKLVINIDKELPQVAADKDLLIQLLDNLINNAIKFTGKGEITIDAIDYPNNMIRVGVTDNGIGIPEDEIKKIFERFHQVGNVYTDKPGGTGLGLSIAKEITHQFKGTIWCESTVGKGSSFYFTMPVKL